ncbi:MAG: AraC family transcriptional regulator [Bacteroides sp.]
MLLYAFHIFFICLSFVIWMLLGLSGLYLFLYRRHRRDVRLAAVIIIALWAITSYNICYEGIALLQRISLIPSLNSWAFVLMVPLFYQFFWERLSRRTTSGLQWVCHLLLPGALLIFYLCMTLFGAEPDKLIYSWEDFFPHYTTWWGVFRLSCYAILVVEIFVYLPRLFGLFAKEEDHLTVAVRRKTWKEIIFVIVFCVITLLCMLTGFYLFAVLYILALGMIAGYFFNYLPFLRMMKRRVDGHMFSDSLKENSSAFALYKEKKKKKDPVILFSPLEAARVEEALQSLLDNPNLTIGMLARRCATNKTYLSRYFNQQLGMSFSEYINTCRLRRAEDLLRTTDDAIIIISEQAGFQSISAFYRAFSLCHEMPPSLWRKNIKNE